ncbi:MAG TPA: hypothetical protein PKG63_05975 [Bacteroidales bacterium]|jgi:hypothetical protein|nr:hypothetical protein [Bacteroidales bacterium]HOU98126.1 hypothetical protein [Bacteroidales bacterium]
MKKSDLTPEEIEIMREVYQNELNILVKKIEKVKKTLEKLGVPVDVDTSIYKKNMTPNEIYAKEIIIKPTEKKIAKDENRKKVTKTTQKILYRWEEIEKRAQTDPLVKEFLDKMNDDSIPVIEFDYKKRAKKEKTEEPVTEIIASNYRRKKNILWSDYVYDVIRLTGFPLTVDEIKVKAIKDLSLDKDETEASFAAIHSSLYRLKRNQGSINNYALKGSRTSYYGLSEWFSKEGKLLKKHERPE